MSFVNLLCTNDSSQTICLVSKQFWVEIPAFLLHSNNDKLELKKMLKPQKESVLCVTFFRKVTCWLLTIHVCLFVCLYFQLVLKGTRKFSSVYLKRAHIHHLTKMKQKTSTEGQLGDCQMWNIKMVLNPFPW